MSSYSYDFYEKNADGIIRSARQIVPIVVDLVRPRSVIDVGCGIGNWLLAFQESGIEDILGIDGEWVREDQLKIPHDKFSRANLAQPLKLDRRFDLAVSLEVAEHLPDSAAETFVHTLTGLAPVVLFSAAIPHQGGMNHINEQWPDYWVQHFDRSGYVVIDALRRKIWQNESVEYYYAQNIFLFARREHLESLVSLKREYESTDRAPLSLVHPKKYLETNDWYNNYRLLVEDLAGISSADDVVMLADEDNFRPLMLAGKRIRPFVEKDGQYWGPPDNGDAGIREIEQAQRAGVAIMAFAWTAFWWLEYYADLARYLNSNFRCVLKNDRLIAFDLRS